MKCPKCDSAMETVSFTGKHVERCTGCKGLWIRKDEFAQLKRDDWLAPHIDQASIKEGRKFDALEDVACPVCAKTLHHVVDEKQSHIMYEQCPAGCGVFFDAGEFKDLATETFWDKFKTKHKFRKNK